MPSSLHFPWCHVTVGIISGADYYGCFTMAVTSPVFWLTAPLVAIGAILPDVTRLAVNTASRPSLMDLLRAIDHAINTEHTAAAGGARAVHVAGGRRFKTAMVVPTSEPAVPLEPPVANGSDAPRRTRVPVEGGDGAGGGKERPSAGSGTTAVDNGATAGSGTVAAGGGAPDGRWQQEARTLAGATSSHYATLLRSLRSYHQRASTIVARAAALGGGSSAADERELMRKNDVVMSSWWLRFTSDPLLERRFTFMYSRQTLLRTRSVCLVLVIGVFAYATYSTVTYALDASDGAPGSSGSSTTLMMIILLYAAGAAVFVLWLFVSRVGAAQDRLHELTAFVGVAFSIGSKLLLNTGGFYSFHGFPMLFSFLLRLRFTLAFPLCLFDLCVYLLFWGLRRADVIASAVVPDVSEVVLILFVWVLMSAMCLYGSRVAERAARRDFLLQLELRASRQMAQAMLNNMLPEHIVGELESTTGMVLSTAEPLVSVLFCDIVDFHGIVAKLPAVELVRLLDRVWSRFDLLCEKHNVIKMETVGATYMAVGGLSLDGCQPVEITRMAFECCEVVNKIYHGDADEQTPLQVRIGLHCGPVLSGVVGTKKPQFSLFGDTVNTAARMQSTGEAMGVQMSSNIYAEWMLATVDVPAERETYAPPAVGWLSLMPLRHPPRPLARCP